MAMSTAEKAEFDRLKAVEASIAGDVLSITKSNRKLDSKVGEPYTEDMYDKLSKANQVLVIVAEAVGELDNVMIAKYGDKLYVSNPEILVSYFTA